MQVKTGIVGASGYGGVELLRLCAAHPAFEVVVATANTQVGRRVGEHTPSLQAAYPSLSYGSADVGSLGGLDVVFFALPHGESQALVSELFGKVDLIVDLAADFRLQDP